MTALGAQDLVARLQQLATTVPPPDDVDTAERALALNHRRRLRGGRWVAGAVAVVVLGTGAALARPTEVASLAEAAPAPTWPGTPPPEVYEQPPRGSLADDPEFLAGVAALTWSSPVDGTGNAWPIEAGSRRVVYAADVPGGHRWAVVMARWHHTWAVSWFAGPSGAAPEQLTEAHPPAGWSTSEPVALMDVSAVSSPLVVIAEPGATFEYSPSLDRAPDGTLVRDFQPLPVVDGVPFGMVPTPVTWDAGQLDQLRGANRSQVSGLQSTGEAPWNSWWQHLEDQPDEAVLAACLTAHGFTVETFEDATGVAYSDPRTMDLSSAESAAREQEAAGCHLEATTG